MPTSLMEGRPTELNAETPTSMWAHCTGIAKRYGCLRAKPHFMKWPADSKSRWTEVSRRLFPAQLDSSLRLAVLAAHPDDETIGASRLLRRLSQPLVIYLTDGAPRDTRF